MNTMKNWPVLYSEVETSLPPYQKPRAMARKLIDWEMEYQNIVQMRALPDFEATFDSLSSYCRSTVLK